MRELSKKEGVEALLRGERGKRSDFEPLRTGPDGRKGSGHLDGRAVGSVRSLTKPMLHFAAH